MKTSEFRHNNMVPFYGAKIKGQMYNNATESQLDNMVGAGSQSIKKTERAPLFEPKNEVQYPYGMPDMTDFFVSRAVPSNLKNNVKPFESVQVAPGLNQGYESKGSGGYNSGMEQRDIWKPKNVDELRVDTNPKMTYNLDGLQGPVGSIVKNVGIEGFVEKNRPDTFYINSQNRLFTTTGVGHAGQLLPVQPVYQNNRSNPTPYEGAPTSNSKSSYHIGEYETPKRPELDKTDINIPTLQGMGPLHEQDRLNSVRIEHNNRSKCNQPVRMGNSYSSNIRASIAPFLDVLKPTRKENVSGLTIYGNTNSLTSGTYVINPYDVPKTTNKETTIYSGTGFIGNQKTDATNSLTQYQVVQNQRDMESHNGGFGAIGGSGTKYGNQLYNAVYKQTNNENKSVVDNYKPSGNLPLFSGGINVSQSKDGVSSQYIGVPRSVVSINTSIETKGQTKDILPHGTSDIEFQRINPDILKAFRENPYTFSLTNSA
jgi:hypothetical protein